MKIEMKLNERIVRERPILNGNCSNNVQWHYYDIIEVHYCRQRFLFLYLSVSTYQDNVCRHIIMSTQMCFPFYDFLKLKSYILQINNFYIDIKKKNLITANGRNKFNQLFNFHNLLVIRYSENSIK